MRKLLFGKKIKQLEGNSDDVDEDIEEDEEVMRVDVDQGPGEEIEIDVDLEVGDAIAEEERIERDEKENQQWRALGAVGKVHNIVKWIRRKPQRRAQFLDHQLEELREELGEEEVNGDTVVDKGEEQSNSKSKRPTMLRSDNDTRWNSVQDMVNSVLNQQTRVDGFCQMEAGLVKDRLTETDWSDLKEIVELLKPFKYLTLIGQEKGSDFGSIGTILPGMDMLLETLEKARGKQRSVDSPFQEAIDEAWGLLKKYYNLTDKSPVHIASLVLDPRMKFSYIDTKWPRAWKGDAKKKMTAFYQRYKRTDITSKAPQEHGSTQSKPTYDINVWRFGCADKKEDELTRYLKVQLLVLENQEEFDILKWWKGNALEYPTLARMAIDIFSIPAMSVEPERVFSGYTSKKELLINSKMQVDFNGWKKSAADRYC